MTFRAITIKIHYFIEFIKAFLERSFTSDCLQKKPRRHSSPHVVTDTLNLVHRGTFEITQVFVI